MAITLDYLGLKKKKKNTQMMEIILVLVFSLSVSVWNELITSMFVDIMILIIDSMANYVYFLS